MFCIKCGNPAVAGNFCKKCFLKREKLFELDNFTVNICPACGNYSGGTIENQIKNRVKTKNTIRSCTVKTREYGNRIIAKVICTGIIRPLKSTVPEKKEITITKRRLKCNNCIKLLGGYYEAVLQLRGPNINRILNKVGKILPEIVVVSVDTLKEGYNIKLADKKIAAKVIRQLREYFSVKESYKLVGEKKGKRLYRNFYAIR